MKATKLTLITIVALSLFACQPFKYVAPSIQNLVVELNSAPQGASVYMNGQLMCQSTPGQITLNIDAAQGVTFTFTKDGYKSKRVKFKPTSVTRSLIDNSTGEIIPMNMSNSTLAYNKNRYSVTDVCQWPNAVFCEMEPAAQQTNVFGDVISNMASTISKTKETETSNAAKANKKVVGDGSTSLEQTVIRWYIDSYPKGADVFTRVISSTPDVKNSNQNYVGTTPYETTEAFDIKGLTLNNAGDVQIEVTCEKPGYISQKKRFNVLQAIDQKEISTKFNLVKDEQ